MLASQRQQGPYPGAEFQRIDRAEQKIVRPRFQRLAAQPGVVEGGDDDDRHMGSIRLGPETADEGGTVQDRHLEIGDAKVRTVGCGPVQCLHRIGKGVDDDVSGQRSGQL